jgi:hypothetical protein
MRKEIFQPTAESEVRLLLLIHAFSGKTKALEGRTKLAKLDFFLRYPKFLERALRIRNPRALLSHEITEQGNDIENRMIRFRYGPWDPSYFVILGRLIGRGLIIPVPVSGGVGYKTTDKGATLSEKLSDAEPWKATVLCTQLLRRNFDLNGTFLKEFIYKNFPEVAGASWGERL